MFSFLKKKFVFSISHSANIQSETINDAGQLTNYVIGVNHDLCDNDEEGYLIINKEKVTKKGNEPIFTMKLDLPLLEDSPYFVELLQPFYSAKPIKGFDETLLLDEPTATNLQDIQEVEEQQEFVRQELSEELQNLASSGTTFLNKSDSQSQKIIDVPPLKESGKDIKELLIAEYQQKVAKLEQSLQVKEDEIIQIKQSKSTINSEESLDNKEMVINHNELSYTEVVQQSIQQELLKLEKEVLTMDKTDTIIQETKLLYDKKKDDRIQEIMILLDDKKRMSLEKAEEDYNKRITEIESAYLHDKTTQISVMTSDLNKECQQKIKQNISKQQVKINNFIDKRKSELNSWQKNISSTIEKHIQSLN